jgi:hypothetical protein
MKKQICTPSIIGECPVIIAEAIDGQNHRQVVVEVINGQFNDACQKAFQLLEGIATTPNRPSAFEPEPMSTGKKVKVPSEMPKSSPEACSKVDEAILAVLEDACSAERIEYREPSSNEEAIAWIRAIREEGVRELAHAS